MRVTLECVGGRGVTDEGCDWEGRGDRVTMDNGTGGRRESTGEGECGPESGGLRPAPLTQQPQPDYLRGPRC